MSQLKLTGVSPRVSPQRTRARAPSVRIEKVSEWKEIVPKLKGAKTGGTARNEKEFYFIPCTWIRVEKAETPAEFSAEQL